MHLRQNEDPWGFLYLLFKVHKNPLKTRPFVSYCGNLLHPLGQLITEWLQHLTKIQKSYFQDSFTLKKEFDLQNIPSNARLFICDATSMYTNIKTGPAFHCIGQFALENKEHLSVAPAVLMNALRLIMKTTPSNLGTHIGFKKREQRWERHQRPLGPQSYLESMRRQCSQDLDRISSSIVASSMTS